jgi:hypothetical protein
MTEEATTTGPDKLLLKWGTLKGWDLKSEDAREALRKYADIGTHAAGAMQQHDTDEQRAALCELIDAINGKITNDWSGEVMTKEAAKDYVLNYGRD